MEGACSTRRRAGSSSDRTKARSTLVGLAGGGREARQRDVEREWARAAVFGRFLAADRVAHDQRADEADRLRREAAPRAPPPPAAGPRGFEPRGQRCEQPAPPAGRAHPLAPKAQPPEKKRPAAP